MQAYIAARNRGVPSRASEALDARPRFTSGEEGEGGDFTTLEIGRYTEYGAAISSREERKKGSPFRDG